MYQTFTEIVQGWPGGDAGMSRDAKATEWQVQKWRLRDRIPAEWWVNVVEVAKHRRVKGVTYKTLAKLAAKGRAA